MKLYVKIILPANEKEALVAVNASFGLLAPKSWPILMFAATPIPDENLNKKISLFYLIRKNLFSELLKKFGFLNWSKYARSSKIFV